MNDYIVEYINKGNKVSYDTKEDREYEEYRFKLINVDKFFEGHSYSTIGQYHENNTSE